VPETELILGKHESEGKYEAVSSQDFLNRDHHQDSLYDQAAETFGSSLDRLARAYELDPEARRDLLQEIHLHLWRSFANFDQRCSLRTWVYRVAHNVATGHVIRQRRIRAGLVDLENIETMAGADQTEFSVSRAQALDRLSTLIQRLKPLDRQIIVSYLEEMDAASISEITGLSPANVAMKIHRIKNILRRWFAEVKTGEATTGEGTEGGSHAE
jgi:RNA polymerase sigma-70 factor (ECF subfamily)